VGEELRNKLAYHAYWPYGREASLPTQDGMRHKFTGHERDAYNATSTADDLDYMHARFSSPLTGRFHATDVLPARLRSPQSWNRYAYVEGNPVAFIDPDGLGKVEAVITIVELGFDGSKKFLGKAPKDAAKALQRSGEDLQAASRSEAREIATELSDGRPPIHELGKGKGQYPHYHTWDRSGGHIFYNVASGLTLSHWAEGRGSALETAAFLVDIVNPLALGQDMIDLWSTFGPGGLSEGVAVIAPEPSSSPFTNYTTIDAGPFLYGLTAHGYHTGSSTSTYDLFLSGAICIEGVCQ
jgi:RHS repeat-associated protein